MKIDRLERKHALYTELNNPVNGAIRNTPNAANTEAKTGRATDEYKSAFWS